MRLPLKRINSFYNQSTRTSITPSYSYCQIDRVEAGYRVKPPAFQMKRLKITVGTYLKMNRLNLNGFISFEQIGAGKKDNRESLPGRDRFFEVP